MIFIYFYILYKGNKILHDCNLHKANLNIYQNQSVDYFISCPKSYVQSIDLTNADHISSISVFNNSNLVVTCPQNMQILLNINLYIYDNPNIAFDDNCYFNNVNIFDYPTFNTGEKKKNFVKNINIYNLSYILPFETETKSYIQRCNNDILNIYFTDEIIFECESYFKFSLKYHEIGNIEFGMAGSQINFIKQDDFDENLNDSIIPSVITSLDIYYDAIVNFQDFLKIKSVSHCDLFNNENIEFIMTYNWNRYLNFSSFCPFEDGIYYDKYNNMKGFFDEIVKKTKWRKFCTMNDSYLYYYKSGLEIEDIYMTNTSSYAIIFGTIGGIVFMIISLAFIAKCTYNRKKIKIGNFDEYSF